MVKTTAYFSKELLEEMDSFCKEHGFPTRNAMLITAFQTLKLVYANQGSQVKLQEQLINIQKRLDEIVFENKSTATAPPGSAPVNDSGSTPRGFTPCRPRPTPPAKARSTASAAARWPNGSPRNGPRSRRVERNRSPRDMPSSGRLGASTAARPKR